MVMPSGQKEWRDLDFRKALSCAYHCAIPPAKITVFHHCSNAVKQAFVSLVCAWGKPETLCNVPEATQLGAG